jgi:cytochrome c-type biogenesis protein CcmH/NrfG
MLWFFLWILWFFLLFRVVVDVFRDDNLSGWGKAGWLIFVLILPYLGVLVYLIVRGGQMGARDVAAAQQQQASVDEYIRRAAAGSGSESHADQLAKIADLKSKGVLTDEEFQQAKAKILV